MVCLVLRSPLATFFVLAFGITWAVSAAGGGRPVGRRGAACSWPRSCTPRPTCSSSPRWSPMPGAWRSPFSRRALEVVVIAVVGPGLAKGPRPEAQVATRPSKAEKIP